MDLLYVLKIGACVSQLSGQPVWPGTCVTEIPEVRFASEQQCDNVGAMASAILARQVFRQHRTATGIDYRWECYQAETRKSVSRRK